MSEQFKAVVWMRQVRVLIDADDEGLGWTEKHRKTIQILEKDPLWLKLRTRLVDPRRKPMETR